MSGSSRRSRPGRHDCSVECQCPLDAPYCQNDQSSQHAGISPPRPGQQLLPSHYPSSQLPYRHDNRRLEPRAAIPGISGRDPASAPDSREMYYYPPPLPIPMSYGSEQPHFPSSASLLDDTVAAWAGDEDDFHHEVQSYNPSGGAVSELPRGHSRKSAGKDEATYQCEVKGCGKVFNRSYNFKAHMETHDAKRQYPFPCTEAGCNKKFVRRTDLQRHHQSVHAKERNHGCNYCGRLFARKDTLKRHMEDGCSKRFDIGTLDLYTGESSDRGGPSHGRLAYEREAPMAGFSPPGAPLCMPPHQGTQAGPHLAPYPRQTGPRGGFDDESYDHN